MTNKATSRPQRTARKVLIILALIAMSASSMAGTAVAKKGPTAVPPGKAKKAAPVAPRATSRPAPARRSRRAAKPRRAAKARPVAKAAPVGTRRVAPSAPSTKASRVRSTSTGTSTGTTSTALNSGCTAHKDPRDPGSCQEKGGGNSGDIDPYRGPDAAGNDPATGNDCDEGGGNNRLPYPRSTNDSTTGDSPVDSDNGKGNNRCGLLVTSSTSEEGKGDPQGRTFVPVVVAATILAAQPTVPELQTRTADEGRVSPALADSPAQEPRQADPGSLGVLGAAAGSLPRTGLSVLALLALGMTLAGSGLGLRRLAAH